MPTKEWRVNNPDKVRASRRKWYANNREHAKQKVLERKKALYEWYRAYKKTLKCGRCGESHYACLEFHHKDKEDKGINPAHMARNGYSIKRMKMEFAKCEVLCANCHRKHHWP